MGQGTASTGGGTEQERAATPHASPLLEDWIGRAELAGELGISEDTLSRWETRRLGPPCIRVGRKVLYRRGAVRDWLKAQEDRAARSRGR